MSTIGEHSYHQIAHTVPHHHHNHHHHHHHHHYHWEDMSLSLRWLLVALSLAASAGVSMASRLPLVVFAHHQHHLDPDSDQQQFHALAQNDKRVRVLYQVGSSEKDLPECAPGAVCGKLDTYEAEAPWSERLCRCPHQQACPAQLSPSDGHTILDRTRQLKLCEPVSKLPKCRFFRDITWTLVSGASNVTQQTVHCHCPKGSVAYLVQRQAYTSPARYKYSFACSPQSRLRCQRKEPCRLFTVRKRQELLDEVNTSTLCQCPHAHYCPRHHSDPGVLLGNAYQDAAVRTYSGFCLPLP